MFNFRNFVSVILFSSSFAIAAAPKCEKWMAKLISAQGQVDKKSFDQVTWHKVKENELFCQGDAIRTRKHSRVTFELGNEALVTLEQNSVLIFPVIDKGSFHWLIKLFKGSAFFRSRSFNQLEVDTPFVNAVHEGTEFLVTVTEQQTEISVFDGLVAAQNSAGQVKIDKGQIGIAQKNLAPRVQPLIVRPVDAVQWALYYPPLVDVESFSSTLTIPAIQQALNYYQQGDVFDAIRTLENIPERQQDEHYIALKASFLLMVGSVNKALVEIQRAKQYQGFASTSLALKAIIAVTKNHADKALSLAEKAVAQKPNSVIAQIALSYAHQAKFNISEALAATEQAVQLAPNNALAWTRLAELQLSNNERDDALESAIKAQTLNPNLDRTHTILGFAYLIQVEINQANASFTQAINLNPADPLARLGLGLAKIRKGAIKEGTRELERAVSLDPNNAIMRSYLGKAYYELRNEGFAATELAIAKEMDPNDPTPWFYDAILKQSTNRPVEALHDMQKAIELNDNRGVYRSKFLLDQDAAARGTSLGRIYNELGFQQLGLVEGWKSVTDDPSNYSAHRLLSDSFAGKSGQEIARASELLQSQLLQPLNVNPIQPRLTEDKLLTRDKNIKFSVDNTPQLVANDRLASNTLGRASLNEYNTLFERNQFTFQGVGIIGSNDSYGEELIHSGIWNKLSYSFSQLHLQNQSDFQSDGFQKDNSIKQNLYNAFVQYQISNQLNLQFEYRYDADKSQSIETLGEKNLTTSTDTSRHLYRFGANYQPDSTTNVLFSGIFTKREDDFLNSRNLRNVFSFTFNNITNSDSLSLELQYIKKLQWTKFILGGSYIYDDEKELFTIDFFSEQTIEDNYDLNHTNAYLYSFTHYENLNAILGVSFDLVDRRFQPNIKQVNPKLGLLWNITDSTVIRAAYFQGIKKRFNANQTIEPVQIAGFVQFSDNDTATGAPYKQVGLGLDHKFNESLYFGLEGIYRQTKVPVPDLELSFQGETTVLKVNTNRKNEYSASSYINWTPNKQISTSLEYRLSIFNRRSDDDQFFNPNLANKNEVVHQVPVSINYFAPNGFYSKFRATYIYQKTKSDPRASELNFNSKNHLWSLDALLGYRLPKRYGRLEFGVKNLLNEGNENASARGNDFVESNSQEINLLPERTFFSQLVFDFDF